MDVGESFVSKYRNHGSSQSESSYKQRLFVRILVIATCLFGVAAARAAVFSADAVKAAFLFRFASYVTWPPDATATGSFVIGVVNDDAVAVQLDHLLTGMNVR